MTGTVPAITDLEELLKNVETLPLLTRTTEHAAGQLLLLARDLEPAARRLTPETPPGWEDALIADVADSAAATISASCDSTFLQPGVAMDLLAIAASQAAHVEQHHPELATLTVPVLAHALALGLDVACHTTWLSRWVSAVTIDVVAGRPHPVADHNPTGRLGPNKANTPPLRQAGNALHVLPHLRIGSDVAARFRVSISFDTWGHASWVADDTPFVFAACQPNESLDDFVVHYESVEDRHLVHNLGCTDPSAQRAKLLACIATAEQAGAHFVVLPEYSLHHTQRDAFLAELRAQTTRQMIIVSGSSETQDPDSVNPRNEAWIVVSDTLQSHQLKMTPAVMDDATEGVVGRRELVVYRTEHFAYAVLICRDSTSRDLIELLADLGVNVLLVPAFSRRTGTITQLAASLSSSSQAFSCVAIGPSRWESAAADPVSEHLDQTPQVAGTSRPSGQPSAVQRDEASFSGPYEHHPFLYVAPVDVPGEQRAPVPVVYTFTTDTRVLQAHQVAWPAG